MPTDAETLKKLLPNASDAFLRLNSGVSLPCAPSNRLKSGEVAVVEPMEGPKSEARRIEGKAGFSVTLPYPPSSNRYWQSFPYKDKQTGRLCVAVFVTKEAKEYKAAVAKLAGNPMLAGPIGMRVRVYRPQRSGDLGNRIKVLEDALQGVLFANDSQIEYEELFRRDDKANPRVEVEVWQLPAERQGDLPI